MSRPNPDGDIYRGQETLRREEAWTVADGGVTVIDMSGGTATVKSSIGQDS